ncbi:MAG: hypothetical protein CMJ84_16205 [Planctomycetes bacterium]|jgi:putative RNA 2'-phosphotransferase|nr:hypothetical protein [Planctomycetota bacterium]MDP6408912.1 RNA 2'-phosphotransferase [Planctomycetota bacterium]
MTHPSLIERITRSLAYMLRHRPDEFDLELDRHGYGELNEVVEALNERIGEPIEGEDVVEAIGAGNRARYEIVEGRIRALYGHSIDVDPGEPTKPPERLYIGVSERDGERAARSGLAGGRRNFLHLALTEEDAIETGQRAGRHYVTITVHALDAWEQDVNFYDRRSLFLSEPIPTDCLEVGDVRDDGREPSERGGRRPRSDRGRGRDRGRERGRDREQSRRDDRDRGERRPASRREEEREERAPLREAPQPARQPVRQKEPAAPPVVGGFGQGIFQSTSPEPEPSPEPTPAPTPAPPVEPVAAAEPDPEPESPESGSSAGSFGAGL